MNFLYSVFFAGGIATFAYTQLGKRVGYGNQQSVWVITAVTFVLSFIFFFTLITLLLGW